MIGGWEVINVSQIPFLLQENWKLLLFPIYYFLTFSSPVQISMLTPIGTWKLPAMSVCKRVDNCTCRTRFLLSGTVGRRRLSDFITPSLSCSTLRVSSKRDTNYRDRIVTYCAHVVSCTGRYIALIINGTLLPPMDGTRMDLHVLSKTAYWTERNMISFPARFPFT